MLCADNSFFHQRYDSLRVLLIVPHEDDEINTAGSLIYTLRKTGADILLVYTTNGDWKYKAKRRFKEAIASASLLGIPEERVVFLGYGDSVASPQHTHLFYHQSQGVKSPAGHEETYGTRKHADYFLKKTGKHHAYTAANYLSDIVDVICEWRPALIISTDFDEHPDHKMLSLYLDRAIGIVRNNNPDYSPELWKSFAYALAYTAVPDYSSINNPETKRPQVGITEKYSYDIIGQSFYDWETRIRIPVPRVGQPHFLRDEMIAKALRKHRSQYIITRADRIINSDQVFFARRTDNIAALAEVYASSGDGKRASDFMLYNVKDIDENIPEFEDYCWQPNEQDPLKKLTLRWKQPQTIEQIALYGAITPSSSINSVIISLSDGTVVKTDQLPCNGNPLLVNIGCRKDITWCELTIASSSGTDFGISECEIYSSAKYTSAVHPFCKILIKDSFCHEYYVTKRAGTIPIGIYRFGTEDDIRISTIKGKSTVQDNQLHINAEDDLIVLRAENEDGSIYDQVIIRVVEEEELRHLKQMDLRNQRYIKLMKYKMKIHNMLFILQTRGIHAVIRRTIVNVIRPKLLEREK